MNPTYLSSVTPEINRLANICLESDRIDPELYKKYEVKRGLRDLDGKGVLTGLTEISTINSSRIIDGVSTPIDGELYYRGINVVDLVEGFVSDNRFGYEETVYLLLFGELPTMQQLTDFTNLLGSCRTLPNHFTRDVIMKTPNKDIMNALA